MTPTTATTAALDALIRAHCRELKLPTIGRRYAQLAAEATRNQQTSTAYLAAIQQHGDAPYDRAFMERTFEDFWQHRGQYTTGWTNALLSPPPEHVLKLLAAGNDSPEIAHRFANGFDNPTDFFDWFMFPDKAEAYLEQVGAAA